jgi:hypothetical protein
MKMVLGLFLYNVGIKNKANKFLTEKFCWEFII